jgi:splicing factor 3A subunit 2
MARLKADNQDPYILRTHLGTLECRLCLTLHVNEGSYLAHTQGKKHQTNLARRAAQDNKSQSLLIAPAPAANQVKKKVFVKIGRPGKSQSRRDCPRLHQAERLGTMG